MRLIHGDCLKVMPELIDEGVKVDLVLTDPPYDKTNCQWDSIIPVDEMWSCINGLTHEYTNTLLFGDEPFASHLRLSNLSEYRYDWVWIKEQGTGFQTVKYRPLRKNEHILVFNKKSKKYNPQMIKLDKPRVRKRKKGELSKSKSAPYARVSSERVDVYHYGYPINILEYRRDRGYHPTQKPVKLLEYLIETYTEPNDIVLDFTMGSGSTGVACQNTGREFIGIELDEGYYNLSKKRIDEVQRKLI